MPELGAMRIMGIDEIRITENRQEYNNCIYVELVGKDDSCTIEIARDYMDGEPLPEVRVGDLAELDPIAGEIEYESWARCYPLGPSDLESEHAAMLANLKFRYADRNDGGRMNDWKLIHQIDPDWPNPWASEPEIADRDAAEKFYWEGRESKFGDRNPYGLGCIAANLWTAGRLNQGVELSLDRHYGNDKEEQ